MRRWPFHPCERVIFPVPVFFMRFAAARRVLTLGIVGLLFLALVVVIVVVERGREVLFGGCLGGFVRNAGGGPPFGFGLSPFRPLGAPARPQLLFSRVSGAQ